MPRPSAPCPLRIAKELAEAAPAVSKAASETVAAAVSFRKLVIAASFPRVRFSLAPISAKAGRNLPAQCRQVIFAAIPPRSPIFGHAWQGFRKVNVGIERFIAFFRGRALTA